jgi:hypothetical protein
MKGMEMSDEKKGDEKIIMKNSATTGDRAHSATTGDYAHSATTGRSAHSATTGNYAHSATTGNSAIAGALGIHSRAKVSSKSAWLVIADWRFNRHGWKLHSVVSKKPGHKINGVTIKTNTWYWFEKGRLKSEAAYDEKEGLSDRLNIVINELEKLK